MDRLLPATGTSGASVPRLLPGAERTLAGQLTAWLLPPTWLDEELVASAVRAAGRNAGGALLAYGVPEGYLPLRQQLSRRLAQAEIGATAG